MKNHVAIHTLLCAVIVIFMAACSSTNVTGLWKKSDYAGQPLTSVLVVALTDDNNSRVIWEDKMALQFNNSGVSAVPSAKAFPGDEKITKEEVLQYVEEKNIESILVTSLVDVKKETTYHPPTMSGGFDGSYGYYNRFDRYYPRTYDRVYSPGYTATSTKVLLETNLYQSDSRELIWSMSSKTSDPASVNTLVESVGKQVVKNLKDANLI
ncbi:MAG: hypothetical protein GQ559_10390 [Desulfobulbaceae bacterium]|nr:hypothetical protein [Desulfobulbaceae bacterium]